jgi:hypothetical protein
MTDAEGLPARLSAPAYFGCVVLITLAGFGAAMLAHPAFGHGVLQAIGLEEAPRALPGSFYAARVQPLLDRDCVACHGSQRQKGDLRLDSLAAVMLGGRSGLAVIPGDVRHSELLVRIALPPSDDRAMPPEGKTPLTDDEKTVIRLWVANGASASQRQIKGAPKPVKPVTIPDSDPALVAKARAPLAAVVAKLRQRFAGMVEYESRGSVDLAINVSLLGPRFGDPDMSLLAPVAAHIARADFSGTAISDAAAPSLAGMTALESLRLSNTKVTDVTVQALGPLKHLRSLAVTQTGVSAAGVKSLRQRGVTIYSDADGQ